MRLSNTQAVSRPTYYDRNPVKRQALYAADSVAPHALTVRFTYTAPAGKKAFVEVAKVLIIRETAATTAAPTTGQILLTPSGLSGGIAVTTYMQNNVVGTIDRDALATQVELLPGDAISGQTADQSTAGGMGYNLHVAMDEFDL